MSWETYNTASKKYLPFNLTRIVNNSTIDIWFYPNQDTSQPLLISAGTIQTIDKRTYPAIASFAIERAETGTANAGDIVVTNSREGQDATSIIERLHSRLFGDGGGI